MKATPLFQYLAILVGAYKRCKADASKSEWQGKHEGTIEELVKAHMPSGSGFDSGTTLDLDASTEDKLVFHTSYHHMNGGGFYDGWTEHNVTIKPSLAFGYSMTISGRNRNDIKDYIVQSFDYPLRQLVDSEGKIGGPVQPIAPTGAKGEATCGTCGRTWDDSKPTAVTPAPAGRCPFESLHVTK